MNNYPEGKRSFSLGELSGLLDAEFKGDPDLRVSGIGALESAAPGQLSFLVGSRYRHLVSGCKAAALIVSPEFRDLSFNLLIVKIPIWPWLKLPGCFCPIRTMMPEYIQPLLSVRVSC